VPNFVDDFCIDGACSRELDTWLVGARLTADKGVAELIRAWPKEHQLTVCGAGPDEEQIRLLAACNPNIELVGTLSREDFRRLLVRYTGVILPSRWPEVAPQVLVEAACAGKPVMVHDSTLISNDVVKAASGLSYSTAGDLSKGITEISDNYSRFSISARLSYENSFTQGAWLASMLKVFQSLEIDTKEI
jgi:glycosyltransferase involved in cell wall biosynthesis